MLEPEFYNWLIHQKGQKENTAHSRRSDCLRVERVEGNLDTHFEKDRCYALLDKLVYTAEDANHHRPPKHGILIDGNIKNGTATLKQAVSLYAEFKMNMKKEGTVLPLPIGGGNMGWVGGTTRKTHGGAAMVKLENKIESVNRDLALILGKLAYHIAPEIVRYIAEQNKKDYDDFKRLFAGKIEVEQYLFSGSACVFPGVRRYVSSHKDVTRKYNEKYKAIVDDNVLPRHIWCFLLSGNAYSSPTYKKTGLNNFELAHIFAHKESEINDEKAFFTAFASDLLPYGNFTSAANVVLLPKGTVRPTDNSTALKAIFYMRYIDLYGEETLHGRKGFIKDRVPGWYADIEWNTPLLPDGWQKNIDALLAYRKDRITSILKDK